MINTNIKNDPSCNATHKGVDGAVASAGRFRSYVPISNICMHTRLYYYVDVLCVGRSWKRYISESLFYSASLVYCLRTVVCDALCGVLNDSIGNITRFLNVLYAYVNLGMLVLSVLGFVCQRT